MEVSFPFMVDISRAADSPLRAVRFAYDGRGRLTNRTDAVAATAYTHDAGNLLLSVREAGQAIRRSYDPLGRLESYTDAAGHTLRYSYDAANHLARLQYPDGRAVRYAYDGRSTACLANPGRVRGTIQVAGADVRRIGPHNF
jgi:YD repeat-containing protein